MPRETKRTYSDSTKNMNDIVKVRKTYTNRTRRKKDPNI